MSQTESLIEREEAKQLSERLYPLGDQVSDICADFDLADYGAPASVIRHELEMLAGTKRRAQQLRLYWSEYAKERIAGLVGPMNVLTGKLPDVTAYRSGLLADLRARAAASQPGSDSPIMSPQIEPTMKRYVELMPDDPVALRINEAVKQARRAAARKLSLPELQEFMQLPAKARYDLLIDRYSATLVAAGFTLDSHRKTGVVFRRLTSDGQWSFLFVDDSRDGVDVGMLSVKFGLTLPKKAVMPSALSSSAVAIFSPDDIVPGFGAARGFATPSYAEFCLAADACAYMARAVYERVDALLR